MMRIGYDAKQAFFNKSGLGSYSRNLLHGLAKNYPENEYFLYTPGIDFGLFEPQPDQFSIKAPKKLFHRIFRSYWRSFSLSRQLNMDRIDIFHGLTHEIPYNFPMNKIKSLVTIHDLIFLRLPHLYRAIDRSVYEHKIRYACATSNRIIAVSKQTAMDIMDFFDVNEEKIDVVYQGCNPMFSRDLPQVEKEILRLKYLLPKSFILYVGTIEERKNLLTLIKALYYSKIDIPLVVIGKHTRYLNRIIEFIEMHGLINVIFCDAVQNQDLPGIYQLADLFVYPSIFEGFGIPILEALYSKVPVITSKGGCFAEAGGPSTLYVDPNNVDEMAAAIKKVLSDKRLKETMIKDGYRHARKFDEEKVSSNIINVYQQVVDNA
ncbi:MAG: glycosyltransferase family 4 protein [Bacteroidales bacterium]|nr:glycosyltransferase family 4 protein [Bacteroidales bacterium]